MGGPCLLRPTTASGAAGAKAIIGPSCTDNFQSAPFEVDGLEYQSVEQAYQSLKFVELAMREKIRKVMKKPTENESAFGMRCWQAAHSAAAKLRKDLEAVKVESMYRLMRAKYDQHPELQRELLATMGSDIEGGPCTIWTSKKTGKKHRWQDWNALIQIRIREELSSPDSELLGSICARFDQYLAEEGGAKLPLPVAIAAPCEQPALPAEAGAFDDDGTLDVNEEQQDEEAQALEAVAKDVEGADLPQDS